MSKPVCEEMVPEPPGYWHEHQCGRTAKFLVLGRYRKESDPKTPVCGTHVKWYLRWRPEGIEDLGRVSDEC